MAYNTKYILNYCNKERTPLRIELQVKDYVGEAFVIVNEDDYVLDSEGRYVVANIDGSYNPERDKLPVEGSGNPFSLTYLNDSGEKNGTIRASTSRMEFFEDLNFNIDDLATSDETEIRCAFYFNNELEWIGFVVPDFFNVEITESPVIDLTASDRIGILKDVEYPIEDFYTDAKDSLLSVFLKCIEETGLELPINVVCSLYCDQFDNSTVSPDFDSYEFTNYLADTYVSELAFVKDFEKEEALDCYTILKRIMDQANCLLTQYKGEWWVMNKADLENGQGVRIKYYSDGIFQSVERFSFEEVTFNAIDTGGQRTIIPAGAVNTYRLDLSNNLRYPKNNRIRSIGEDLDDAPKWTSHPSYRPDFFSTNIPVLYNNQGITTDTYQNEQRVLNIASTNIVTLSNDTTNFAIVPPSAPANSWILQSEEFKVVTMDGKKSSFKLSVDLVAKPNSAVMLGMFMKIKHVPSNSYRYFAIRRYPGGTSGGAVELSSEYWFVAVADINASTNINLVPIYPPKNQANTNIAISFKHEFEMNIAAAVMQAEDYNLNDATFFFRIYPNSAYKKDDYNSALVSVRSVIREISLEFKTDNQTPTGNIYQSRIDGRFTKKNDQVNLIFGDFQEVGQNGFFYKYREDSLSITYNSAGQRLKDWWTPYDDERNPQIIHAMRQQTRAYGRAHDELAIGLDLNRINPFAHYAVKCFSDYYVTNEENEYLTNDRDKYITASIGKYLNNKRFVFVEGTIDYLRSHFSGKLAQIRTEDIDSVEYIYSDFGNN